MSDTWPKHRDGRNKKVGEMTSEEVERVTREAVERLKPEFAGLGVALSFKTGTPPTETQH